MSVRYKGRRPTSGADKALHDFVELAYPARGSASVNARVRGLIEFGEQLGMTAGDTVRLATATLNALDQHGQLQPAIDEVLTHFKEGRLVTEFREPMNLYLEESAVAALAVELCETCRPAIAMEPTPSQDEPATKSEPPEQKADDQAADPGPAGGSGLLGSAALWPERNREGFPQMTLPATVWWPGLHDWEEAELTATVTPSLAFADENFTLLIRQEGDAHPARVPAVWLLKRHDLNEPFPIYELRGSTWSGGNDAHQFRFLVASSSLWLQELHDFLAARWVSKGQSPTGPKHFDSKPLGGGRPPIRVDAS